MSLERFDERDTLLTLQEAMKLLRVSRATMFRWLASGHLVGHKVGGRWRFYKVDLHAFIAGQDRSGARNVAVPSKQVSASHHPE